MKNQNWSMRLFAVLVPIGALYLIAIPYSWLNSKVIVNWLGCGCPRMDEYGNLVETGFNANDFTAIFWLLMGILDGVLAFFLAKRFYENGIFRWIYFGVEMVILGIICISLYQGMMWN